MKIINSLPIYSIHFSKLIEREELIRYNSNILESPIEIITELIVETPAIKLDSVDLKKSLAEQVESISPYFLLHEIYLRQSNANNFSKQELYRNYLRSISDPSYSVQYIMQALSSQSKANYTLCQQHYLAIEKFVQSNQSNIALILEDDAMLIDISNLNDTLNQISKIEVNIPFYVDISDSLSLNGIYYNKFPSSSIYKVLPGQTRCASAYIINKKAALKMLSEKLFLLPIDWHLSYVLNKHFISTFWSRLASFSQLSDSIFKSNRDFRNS